MSFDRKYIIKQVSVRDIKVDQKYQSRLEGLNEQWVDNLREMDSYGDITAKNPICVFAVTTGYMVLVDGFHRLEARKRNGNDLVTAIVYTGTERDALLFSLTYANINQPLPLTQKDREHRVERILLDYQWGGWSISTISNHTGVSRHTVRKVRDYLIEQGKYSRDNSCPADLNYEEQAKWDEIISRGDKPIICEREGKRQIVRQRQRDEIPQRERPPEVMKPVQIEKVENENPDIFAPEPVKESEPTEADKAPPDAKWMKFTDSYGNKIPRLLRDIFISDQSLKGRITTEAKALRTMPIKDWMDKVPWLKAKRLTVCLPTGGKKTIEKEWDVEQVLTWLYNCLQDSRPEGVCGICEGDGCDTCEHTGWLPGHVYNSIDWEKVYGVESEISQKSVGSPTEDDSGGE